MTFGFEVLKDPDPTKTMLAIRYALPPDPTKIPYLHVVRTLSPVTGLPTDYAVALMKSR
jgi:hypothetical protein